MPISSQLKEDFVLVLQVDHVNSQTQANLFVCLWTGCKVYSRSSCSRSWLEGHVLSHVGKKPFRCIVDGCGLRFSSQVRLPNQLFTRDDNL